MLNAYRYSVNAWIQFVANVSTYTAIPYRVCTNLDELAKVLDLPAKAGGGPRQGSGYGGPPLDPA